MFGNMLFIQLLNIVLIVVFIQVAKRWQKTHLVALIYAAAIAVVTLMPNMLLFNLIGFIANFLFAYGVFILRRKTEGTWWTVLIAIIGGILMWYVAYLPVAYVQDMVLSAIL